MLKKSSLTCIMNKKSIINIFIINKLYINHNLDNAKKEINNVKCTVLEDSIFTSRECLYKKKIIYVYY